MSAWSAPSATASVLLSPAPPPTTVEDGPAAARESPRWRRTAGLVASGAGRFLALSWCFTGIWLLLWGLTPMLVGWQPNVVTSGSMAPSLPIGSVVHIDDGVDLNTVGVGSIIAFEDPAISGMRVTHRVTGIEVDGEQTVGFRTKGDANEAADSTVVPVENVYGVARLVVPYAGLPNAWVANGNAVMLSAFVMLTIGASVIAFDTLQQFLTGRPRRRRPKAVVGIAVAIAAMLGAPSSSAAFVGSTSGPTDTITMTTQWFLDTVDRDNPTAHWRLGDGAPVTVLYDDFESFTGYFDYGAGTFVSSTAQARSGTRSGLKTLNNDPNGGFKLLPATVTDNFVFEVWVYRPSGFAGGPIDRLGLEDASFNGYTFHVNHSNNRLRIDRRTGGSPTTISPTISFNPPEDTWYRLELVRTGASMVLTAYDGGGTALATTSATDSTTTSFDRLTVRGGWDYYVDDLTVIQTYPNTTTAVDRIGTLDGTFTGFPTPGAPGLVTGQPDTAVEFDGVDDGVLIGGDPLINGTTRSERTTELWFDADVTTGRQVLYEEGGATNGLSIYVDGTTLYAVVWSLSQGWSNDLVTRATVSANTTHHVAAVLDTAGGTLDLFLDGTPVDQDTKSDANPWNAHIDDGAVAQVNGSTRFHDGPFSGTGGFPFDGVVDEVILYNSLVPAANIANHFQSGV